MQRRCTRLGGAGRRVGAGPYHKVESKVIDPRQHREDRESGDLGRVEGPGEGKEQDGGGEFGKDGGEDDDGDF